MTRRPYPHNSLSDFICISIFSKLPNKIKFNVQKPKHGSPQSSIQPPSTSENEQASVYNQFKNLVDTRANYDLFRKSKIKN